MNTQILAPFRACGLTCSSVAPIYKPFTHLPIQGEVLCPVESVICIYSVKPFRLHTVTDALKENIDAVARTEHFIFAVSAKTLYVFKFYKLFKHYKLDASARFVLACGETAFVVVDAANRLGVYDVGSDDCLLEIESPSSFKISALVHPAGYLNQLLLGAEDGRMRLVNVETGELVREFPSDANFNGKISVIAQSTAADVVAVGLVDGRIHLRHLKRDSLLFTFRHESGVTALSFRSDEVETLVSGAADGSIAVWDLDARLLVGRLADAHSAGPVISLNCLLGESFFISTGVDNRVVKWMLKDAAAMPELVKQIEGPREPVCALTFTGPRSLIFASRDGSLRNYFNFQQDNSLKTMGVAQEVKRRNIGANRFVDARLPAIVGMEMVHAREAAWDNVICRHEASPFVSTWSTRRLAQGSHLLCHERFTKNLRFADACVASCFLSSCGTFALLGYSSGHLDVFHMQSGKLRNSLVDPTLLPPVRAAEKRGKHFDANNNNKGVESERLMTLAARAHAAAIRGIALDPLNATAVSGAADGALHFWAFSSGKLTARLCPRGSNAAAAAAGDGVVLFRLNRLNSLLAVAYESGAIAVVDVLCRRVARHFAAAHSPASARVGAMAFSADGKWLLSADGRGTLKIWDLSSSRLLNVVRFAEPCVDMCFNESGEFLATAHRQRRAIYVWANKALFLPDFNAAPVAETAANSASMSVLELPRMAASSVRALGLEDEDEEEDERLELTENSTMDENSMAVDIFDELRIEPANVTNLVGLSGLAPSRWANLAQLDAIRERNKPVEPPKRPETAPFFLPAIETLQGFSFERADDGGGNATAANHEEEDVEMEQPTAEMDENKNHSIAGDETKNSTSNGRRPVLMAKRNADNDGAELHTAWAELLRGATFQSANGDVEKRDAALLAAFDALKAMNISSVDFQIRALVGDALTAFLAMIQAAMRRRRAEFDLAQAYLAAFLNAHNERLTTTTTRNAAGDAENDASITKALKLVLDEQKRAWPTVQDLIYDNVSLAKWIKSALI